MCSLHYSATELQSRNGCHVKQRDTSAELLHAHIYQVVLSGAFNKVWYVVVINGLYLVHV